MISSKSARTAILQAYSVDMQGSSDFTPVVSGGRASSTSRIAHRYEAGIVIAAVENQDFIRHWLLWAYGPATMQQTMSAARGASMLVAGRCEIAWDGMTDPVRARTEALIYVHMDNYRALAVTGNRKYRKPAHVAAALSRFTGGALSLNLSNYKRDFEYLERLVHDACESLDRDGLGPVARSLTRLERLQGAA